MPVDPIKIPQNVYIEDRIVGPLTLKQIITVAVGCGFSYALYSLLIQSYGKLPLPLTVMAWVPGLLSFVFAFIKINDLSLFKIVLLAVERINKPSTRVWTPRRGIVINIRTFTTPQENHHKNNVSHAGKNPDQIEELSSILDRTLQANEPTEATEPAPAAPAEAAREEEQESASAPRPVDPARISASEQNGYSTDTVMPPRNGAVSIFRDLSPR